MMYNGERRKPLDIPVRPQKRKHINFVDKKDRIPNKNLKNRRVAMKIYNENCIDGMKKLDTDSVDLIVTDPPYGMSFMGKNWDKALPPLEAFEEMHRVLKPGAFAFVMCAPRSDLQSRMSILLEDAGFDISFTPIYWTFATGFPKAQNISKQIDKRNGRHYPTSEFKQYLQEAKKKAGLTTKEIDIELTGSTTSSYWSAHYVGNSLQLQYPTIEKYQILKRILKLDNRFDELIEREEAEREIIGSKKSGIGTAFGDGEWKSGKAQDVNITKDATPEAQQYSGAYAGFQPKPAVEVVIVAMKPRTEKTYVDQCLNNGHGITWLDDCRIPSEAPIKTHEGRFPANLLVSDDSLNDGTITVNNIKSGKHFNDSGSYSRYFDLDAWFAIIPKPSKKEKNEGTELNNHPTVKPIKLMSYLITLGSREEQVVLDPFMGSGTTGIAAHNLNRQFIGYEMEPEYYQIAEARINARKTGTTRQNKEDGCQNKEDGQSKSNGSRTGQATLTSN